MTNKKKIGDFEVKYIKMFPEGLNDMGTTPESVNPNRCDSCLDEVYAMYVGCNVFRN